MATLVALRDEHFEALEKAEASSSRRRRKLTVELEQAQARYRSVMNVEPV